MLRETMALAISAGEPKYDNSTFQLFPKIDCSSSDGTNTTPLWTPTRMVFGVWAAAFRKPAAPATTIAAPPTSRRRRDVDSSIECRGFDDRSPMLFSPRWMFHRQQQLPPRLGAAKASQQIQNQS